MGNLRRGRKQGQPAPLLDPMDKNPAPKKVREPKIKKKRDFHPGHRAGPARNPNPGHFKTNNARSPRRRASSKPKARTQAREKEENNLQRGAASDGQEALQRKRLGNHPPKPKAKVEQPVPAPAAVHFPDHRVRENLQGQEKIGASRGDSEAGQAANPQPHGDELPPIEQEGAVLQSALVLRGDRGGPLREHPDDVPHQRGREGPGIHAVRQRIQENQEQCEKFGEKK